MAASRRILCSSLRSSSSSLSLSSSSPLSESLLARSLRLMTTSSTSPSHHGHGDQQHEFSKPSEFLGSWKASKDPKYAESNLGRLRREYAKQVKELRKEYIYEMELQRQEKQRKDEAKREAITRAREERKAAKAEMKKAKAAERKAFEEEFRQTLLKERDEKLENWRLKEKSRGEKKQEKKELIHRQSSMWIDERDLDKEILAAIVDTAPL